MSPQAAILDRRRGRRPLALRALPRDIFAKMKAATGRHFIFAANIPAGGSDAGTLCHSWLPGAQNPSFKDFSGPGARA